MAATLDADAITCIGLMSTWAVTAHLLNKIACPNTTAQKRNSVTNSFLQNKHTAMKNY